MIRYCEGDWPAPSASGTMDSTCSPPSAIAPPTQTSVTARRSLPGTRRGPRGRAPAAGRARDRRRRRRRAARTARARRPGTHLRRRATGSKRPSSTRAPPGRSSNSARTGAAALPASPSPKRSWRRPAATRPGRIVVHGRAGVAAFAQLPWDEADLCCYRAQLPLAARARHRRPATPPVRPPARPRTSIAASAPAPPWLIRAPRKHRPQRRPRPGRIAQSCQVSSSSGRGPQRGGREEAGKTRSVPSTPATTRARLRHDARRGLADGRQDRDVRGG